MGWLSARDVLWYLTFCGFAINYMLRININIAIVGMVRSSARHKAGGAAAAVHCATGGGSGLDANYTGDTTSPHPWLSSTPSFNRTELNLLNNTGVTGTDIETTYTILFKISSPTPKSVEVNTSKLTGTVEVTRSVSGTNFSSTQVPISRIPEDYNIPDSAHGVSSWTVSSRAPFVSDTVNDTGTAATEFSDVDKGRSAGDGTTASPLKTSSLLGSSSVLDRDNGDKMVPSKTLSSLPEKLASPTAPATVSVAGHQLAGADSTQGAQLEGAGWPSTTPAPTLPTALPLIAEEDGRYDWDEYQQGLVLGAFFWLHWSTQIPGGMLSQRIGPKLVFGVSNLVACLLAVLLPLAASIDYRALIAVRVLQGFIAGAAWPSMHSMTANWIPPNDRSKFVTAYLGSSVGAALTFPLCGFLMEWFGWPTVFYTTALLGSAWFLAWWFLVFDHPHVHPRISRTELDYLKTNLGHSVAKRKPPTPWREIVTSLPLWMNVLAQWGGIWGLFTMLTQAPTYFRLVHGWSIRATGLLSGFPHICRISFAMVVSWVGDYMLKQETVSRTNLRKIATALCTVVQGLLVLGLAYSGCRPLLAAACLAAAVGASGAVSTGPLASLVDISPNYASILMGITNMLTVLPGFISPIIVGLLTYQNQTPDAWRVVFLITAAMLVVPGIVYTFCASSELQPWNTPTSGGPHELEAASEKVPLKADVDKDGTMPSKHYLQDDGNLLTSQDFQKDGSLLTKRDQQEDGSVPTESHLQEDGSALTKADGKQTEPDVDTSRDTVTKLEKATIGSFPIAPDADSDEGVPKEPHVEKDGDVLTKSSLEEDEVPIKPGVEEGGAVSTHQELETDGGEPTEPSSKEEDGSVLTKEDDSGTQRKSDAEMVTRKSDESDKADQS